MLRKEVSKELLIIQKSEKLFAEKGFDGTSVREIAKSASVNIAMISYYFGSKEKLIEKIFAIRLDEGLNFLKDILKRTPDNEIESLESFVDAFLIRIRNHKPFFKMMLSVMMNYTERKKILKNILKFQDEYSALIEKIITSGLENKVFKNSANPRMVQKVISGTLFYSIFTQPMAKEVNKNTTQDFDEAYFLEVGQTIKQGLKGILGYEK